MAGINLRDIEKALKDQEIIAQDSDYQNFDELIHDMIYSRCPVEFFMHFLETLKCFPQYLSKAQALEDEWSINRDEVAIGFPTQESCSNGASNDVQAEHETHYQSYIIQENSIHTFSCYAQKAFNREIIRNSPAMIQKCIAAVQNICDAFVEICREQTDATESYQGKLDKLILELERLKLKENPTQEEVTFVINKLNGHLDIIRQFVNATLQKWLGIAERKFAHSAMKFIYDMVEELKRGKSTCEAIPHYEKRFKKMLQELERSVQNDKSKPNCIAFLTAVGGGIITICAVIGTCSIGVALGGIALTGGIAAGAYAVASKAVQHQQAKGDIKWNKCSKKA